METVTLIGRLLVSLAAVLVLMWVIARRVRKTSVGRSGALVDVLSRRQLSRTASVAVVRVLDKALIVGVTDGQVSLIGETDLAAAEQALEDEAPRRAPRPRPTPSVDLSTKIGPDGRILASRPATQKPPVRVAQRRPATKGGLAGSALSPATWRQTYNSLRNLTTR
jgi:flagellar protein FliO/FliZ